MHTTTRTTLLVTLATITVAAGLIAGWGRVLAAPRGHGPIGAQINVSMVDDEGDPVSGATITVRDERDELVHRTTTDGEGAAITNLGPEAGQYRVLAELPARATDLTPVDDTDSEYTPSPRGTCPNWRLCVTFDQNAAGSVSAPGVHASEANEATARFEVRDTVPEPRLAIAELDVTGEQPEPLAGGTVTIARLRRDGTTEEPQTKRFQTQSVLFDGLTAGTYRVNWTPPPGYGRVTAQVHEVTIEKLTPRQLRAERITDGESSRGDDRDASVVPVRVWIHDVTNGAPQPFSGGMLDLFHIDEHGGRHRMQAHAVSGARFDLPGGAVVEYVRLPDGYEMVGPWEDVADAEDPEVTFRVRRIRPRTGDDRQHDVEPGDGDRPLSPPTTDHTLEPRRPAAQPQDPTQEQPREQPVEQQPEEEQPHQERRDERRDDERVEERVEEQPAGTALPPVEEAPAERVEDRSTEEGASRTPEEEGASRTPEEDREAAAELELRG